MQDENNSGWAQIVSCGALIPQTSLGMRCSSRITSGHDVAYVRKGSTWCMADGLMTKGDARTLRAPSLGAGGEGELLEAAGGDTPPATRSELFTPFQPSIDFP